MYIIERDRGVESNRSIARRKIEIRKTLFCNLFPSTFRSSSLIFLPFSNTKHTLSKPSLNSSSFADDNLERSKQREEKGVGVISRVGAIYLHSSGKFYLTILPVTIQSVFCEILVVKEQVLQIYSHFIQLQPIFYLFFI
jgi:hypothetical protein